MIFTLFNNQYNRIKKYHFSEYIFACLMGMSILFALESVSYMDSSYMLFRMLNEKTFIIEGGRFTNFFPQLIPWLLIQLGASIQLVGIAFSLSYLLFYWVIFLIIKNILGLPRIALLLLLLLLLAVPESFFDVITETKQALALACLYFATLSSDVIHPKYKLLMYASILMLGAFSHPFFFVYVVLIHCYQWLFENKLEYKNLFIVAAIVTFRFFAFGSTNYEENLLSGILNPSHFTNSFLHSYLSGYLSLYYKLMGIGFIFALIYLWQSKKTKQLVGSIILSIFVYALLAIVYYQGDSHIMLQKTLFVWHFTLLLPVYYVFDNLPAQRQFILKVGVVLSLLLCLNTIHNFDKKYNNRTQSLTSKMSVIKHISDKFFMDEKQINHDVIMATWALPYETAIISKWQLGNSLSIKNMRNADDSIRLKTDTINFRNSFGLPTKITTLNTDYFQFSQNPYIWIDGSFRLE